jgi:hypothetical protein
VARALQVVETARRATDAYGRSDLTDRLARAQERLTRPDLQALVVGEYKKGKSTLINALLNIPLCPTSDEVATVVPTIVRHGEEAAAEVVHEPVAGEGDTIAAGEEQAFGERQAIALDQIPVWATEEGNADNTRAVRAVEVRVPRQLLRSGLALVDTPGVGGLRSVHGATTMAALGMAEVVVFVTDASQELTAVELSVLRTAMERCPTLVCVLTKTDLYPDWRRIVELDREHLAASGLGHVDVIPVSSLLRQRAMAASSKELNEESGYPALVRFLNEGVVGRAQQVTVSTAVSDVLFVAEQLSATFTAERDVLADPAAAAPVLSALEAAKARAELLRTRSARWQQTLNDGSVDLGNEVDHDLRRRLRDVLGWSDEAVDAHDPLDIWDDFSAWLRHQVAEQVAANAEVLRSAANDLAVKVAEHFAIDEVALTHAVDTGAAAPIEASLELKLERIGRGANALAAVRGSYGGVLMFGMAGQLVGLTLVNPLTAVIGIGMGRRALREERKRQLTIRRQQMKQVIRKYLDDISFAAGKSSRDAVKLVQRDLRNEFTERAEQLQRSTREALAAAEAAARETLDAAKARQRDVQAELDRIAKVRSAADDLGRAAMAGAAR